MMGSYRYSNRNEILRVLVLLVSLMLFSSIAIISCGRGRQITKTFPRGYTGVTSAYIETWCRHDLELNNGIEISVKISAPLDNLTTLIGTVYELQPADGSSPAHNFSNLVSVSESGGIVTYQNEQLLLRVDLVSSSKYPNKRTGELTITDVGHSHTDTVFCRTLRQ